MLFGGTQIHYGTGDLVLGSGGANGEGSLPGSSPFPMAGIIGDVFHEFHVFGIEVRAFWPQHFLSRERLSCAR